MLVQQSKIPSHWKEKYCLATQQLRLRNLMQVLGFNLESQEHFEINETSRDKQATFFYFTLHSTVMSAPFYTSEKLESPNPSWNEIDITSLRGKIFGSESSLVLRIWSCGSESGSIDHVIAVWGIHFNGLAYLGSSLNTSSQPKKPNSIVFRFVSGYFIDPVYNEIGESNKLLSCLVNSTDVRSSYQVKYLSRLHSLQQVIYKQSATAQQLKEKIVTGVSNESSIRKSIIHQTKPERHEVLKVKKKLEEAKCRNHTLKIERQHARKKLESLQVSVETLRDRNFERESILLDYYRMLNREVELYKEWGGSYLERKDLHQHFKSLLHHRSLQLVSELALIYPILEFNGTYRILNVHLPNSEDLMGYDDIPFAVALGYVAHVVQMISVFLQIPLRYPIIHYGSRSSIIDNITHQLTDKDREFPLHSMSRDKFQFKYGVYLLNKNIAQLRWYLGLKTSDLRNTLENLHQLMIFKHDEWESDMRPFSSSPPSSARSLAEFPFSPLPHKLSSSPHSVNRITQTLSFSLDKGLNVYHQKELGAQSSSTSNTTDWSKTKVTLSDEDMMSVSNTNLLLYQTESPINASQSQITGKESRIDLDRKQNVIENEAKSLSYSTNGRNQTFDETNIASIQQDTECAEEFGNEQANIPSTSSVGNNKNETSKEYRDSLTSRTEALANQTTSFNRFRTRFGSMLDS